MLSTVSIATKYQQMSKEYFFNQFYGIFDIQKIFLKIINKPKNIITTTNLDFIYSLYKCSVLITSLYKNDGFSKITKN